MALFSDIDWIVLGGVAAFLLFGAQGRDFLRQLGRLYGRALRFRNEMMSEIGASTGLPGGPILTSGSIRATLLGPELSTDAAPLAHGETRVPTGLLTAASPVPFRTVETLVQGAALGPGVWSDALPNDGPGGVRLR